MHIRSSLLDAWLSHPAAQACRFKLGGSTGPGWTVAELMQIGGPDGARALRELPLAYSEAAGGGPLREAIAAMHGVPADHVLVVAGASEALLHVFFLAAAPGVNAILPSPSFPSYDAIADAFGIEIRRYHLRRENHYRVDLEEIRALADANTRLLLVNSPHNPTGAVVSQTEMAALHGFAAERGLQFVCDEVFHPIYHGAGVPSAAGLPQATVLGDCSKAFGLPGLRIGWIIEPDPARRTRYVSGREHFAVSASAVGEFLATIAITQHATVLARTRAATSRNLRLLEGVIEEHGEAVDWIRPQGGTTALVRLTGGGDARGFCERARTGGLLITPGDCFGAADHFRVGLGAAADLFPQAMEALSSELRVRAE